MSIHHLKIHRKPFEDLVSGRKTSEVRNCADREFCEGDKVELFLMDENGNPADKSIVRMITHIQTGYGLPADLCVLSYGAALSDPVPPAGGEPEVRRWFPNWNMEDMFQHAEGEYVAHEDHQAVVTRLQAEVERLKAMSSDPFDRMHDLQSELTKARELLEKAAYRLSDLGQFKISEPIFAALIAATDHSIKCSNCNDKKYVCLDWDGGEWIECPKCPSVAQDQSAPADKGQGEQVAYMPVERCCDVRAKMIIAFNESRKNGGDLDDGLDAAYKAALRYSPSPMIAEQPAPVAVVMPEPEPAPIKGMIAASGGEFAIMIDEANAHYGWTFKKHPDGMWVSGRKATDAEMQAARQYARATNQQ